MQQKIPGIRYEFGLYSKRIGVFGGLSATNQQSSHYINDRLVVGESTVSPCSGEQLVTTVLASRPLSTIELEAWVQIGDGPVMECLASMELAGKVTYLSDGKWHLIGGL